MRKALIAAAVIIAISAAFLGIQSGSLIAGGATVFSGFTGALTFLTLAAILENQQTMKQKLDELVQAQKEASAEMTVCESCGKEYDDSFNSCPNCGHRDEQE